MISDPGDMGIRERRGAAAPHPTGSREHSVVNAWISILGCQPSPGTARRSPSLCDGTTRSAARVVRPRKTSGRCYAEVQVLGRLPGQRHHDCHRV